MLSLALVIAGWLLSMLPGKAATAGLVYTWMLLAGTLGMALLALACLTDHHAASPNINLLLLNPLMLLAFWRRLRLAVVLYIALASLASWLIWVTSGWQYNVDVMALLIPVNLAGATWLWRHRRIAPDTR